MTSMDSARETIAIFDRDIAQAEAETRQHVERLHAAGLSYDSKQIRDAWNECGEKTRPLRSARESLVKAVATIVGMTAPAPITLIEGEMLKSHLQQTGKDAKA